MLLCSSPTNFDKSFGIKFGAAFLLKSLVTQIFINETWPNGDFNKRYLRQIKSKVEVHSDRCYVNGINIKNANFLDVGGGVRFEFKSRLGEMSFINTILDIVLFYCDVILCCISFASFVM